MYLSVGIPFSGIEWCEQVAHLILKRQNLPEMPHLIDAPGILEREIALASRSPGFFLSRTPIPAAVQWARAQGLSVLLVRRDPIECVARFMRGGFEFDRALRHVSDSCSWIAESLHDVEVLAVTHEEIRTAPSRVAARLVQLMGLDLTNETGGAFEDPEFVHLHEAFVADASTPPTQPLTEEQIKVADGALRFFELAGAEGRPDRAIYWPRSLFYLGDRPGRLVTGRIALIGGARCIFYGPHLLLPTGKWRADTAIAVSEEAVGSSFAFELFAEGVVARGVERADARGLLQNRLRFELATPGTPVQIRIFTERSAIEGHVALGGTIVTRLG